MKFFQPFTLIQIANYTNANIVSSNEDSSEYGFLFYDTRKIYSTPSNSIFIAIVSSSNDGHRYIDSAYKKGIRCFLVSSLPDNQPKDATFLWVEDTLQALYRWASVYRRTFTSTCIGITGSNGKTIVKEWLYQLLSKLVKIDRSPGSFNSEIGVPLSLLSTSNQVDYNVFELGISKRNDMDSLESLIQPNISVLTNFGLAHREGFANKEEHLQEKLKLFKSSTIYVLPGDEQYILDSVKQLAEQSNPKIITFGKTASCNIFLISSVEIDSGTEMFISVNNVEYHVTIPFKDVVSIENILCVFAIVLSIGLDPASIIPFIHSLSAVEMRLEILVGLNNSTLINDSFNSDLTSFHSAIDTLTKYYNKKQQLVLSDFNIPCTENDYKQISDRVNNSTIEMVFLVGIELNKHAHLFNNYVFGCKDVNELLSSRYWNLSNNDAVLIKGSRKSGLELLSEYLQKNSHDTIVEVNLENLISNVKAFKSILKPETMLMCMVKAFSYGVGDAEISQSLQDHGVNYLGVAYAEEGVDLRKNDVTLPIMVMNPEVGSYNHVIDFNLEPEIYSFRVLQLFTEKLISKGVSNAYPIHIKLNTGMNRLGFLPEELEELLQKLKSNSYVKVISILSHFSASDSIEHKLFTINQAEKITHFHQSLSDGLGYNILKHICNTSGIVNYPNFHFDMVRLGIGMYGYSTLANASFAKRLEPVFKLKTLISQIHNLKENDSVGYGRGHLVKQSMKIAVLPIGYADGIDRRLGHGLAKFSINKKWASSVGSICMDMVMVDITEIDCKEGDEVFFFEHPYGVEYYAKELKTIPYEILTSLSYRLKRVYYRG